MIIFKYLGKEVLNTMVAITTVVVFIFICNLFVHYLDYVASGKYAAGVLFHLVFLQVPVLVSLLLPLGLYLGILTGYGRLYAESEMTVLMACGMSRKQLLWMTMVYATVVMLVVALLVLYLNPIFYKKRDQLMDQAKSGMVVQTIMPGEFQTSVDGRNVFYIKEISRDRQKMKDVFMAQKSNKKKQQNAIAGDERWMVLSANTAHQMTDKTTKDQFMVTTNGNRYEGMPGRMDYQTIKFDTYGQRIGTSNAAGDTEGMEIVSTKKLFKLAWSNAEAMGVLQWRISMPISVIILTLLAVPLSKVNPRQGRFAQLFPAVMIYIVYANMMFVGENWIKNGTIPGWLGVWWIHVIMFVVAIGLLFRRRSL